MGNTTTSANPAKNPTRTDASTTGKQYAGVPGYVPRNAQHVLPARLLATAQPRDAYRGSSAILPPAPAYAGACPHCRQGGIASLFEQLSQAYATLALMTRGMYDNVGAAVEPAYAGGQMPAREQDSVYVGKPADDGKKPASSYDLR